MGKLTIIRPYTKPPTIGRIGVNSSKTSNYDYYFNTLIKIQNDSKTVIDTPKSEELKLRFEGAGKSYILYIPADTTGTLNVLEKRFLNQVNDIKFKADFKLKIKKG
jgi:hypothetical protein